MSSDSETASDISSESHSSQEEQPYYTEQLLTKLGERMRLACVVISVDVLTLFSSPETNIEGLKDLYDGVALSF